MFKLTRSATPAFSIVPESHQWPVSFVASNADNSPAKIFVMQQAPPGDLELDFFSCVASVPQMEALPVDAVGLSGPYYRTDSLTLVCRSADSALEFVDKIKFAVQDLANNTQAAGVLVTVEEVTIIPNAI